MRPNELGALYVLATLVEMHPASTPGMDPLRGSNKTALLSQGIVYETENAINRLIWVTACCLSPFPRANHEKQNQEPQGGARAGLLPTSEFQNDS